MQPRESRRVRSLKSDADLEQATHARREDRLADQIGSHTRASIEKFEEAHIPWLRKRRRTRGA